MFDNCGQFLAMGTFEERIRRLIRTLIEMGHEERLMLSHDVCKFGQLRAHGGPGFVYLAESFLPALLEDGVPGSTIRTITHDNPRRWLSGV